MNFMCKTVIAIGSRLMTDDAVGIYAAEKIKDDLAENNIGVVIGETDTDYCLSMLNSRDEFYVIDSMYSGNIPGNIFIKPLKYIKREKKLSLSPHSTNLLDMMNIYGLNIKGYFIGIEVFDISPGLALSTVLSSKFDTICQSILSIIISQKSTAKHF